MSKTTPIRIYLGANSSRGFCSLYSELAKEPEDFLWVIKGGPGCGKSTFMRQIAEAAAEAGLLTETVICSGDSGSLDAVYLPELHCGYVDGTAPHVVEAELPGAGGLYLDLGSFYRAEALEDQREALSQLFALYRAQYARAYSLLAAAAKAAPDEVPGLRSPALLAAVRSRASAMIRRHVRQGGTASEERRFFLSAVTGEGITTQYDTVTQFCPRICTLDNALGLASVFLEQGRAEALQRGAQVISCPDPLRTERLQALLLPEQGLALLAMERGQSFPGAVWRHLRLDAMADGRILQPLRPELRRSEKLYREILESAILSLRRAKELHDQVEAVYNPHVDFAGVNALAAEHIRWLLSQHKTNQTVNTEGLIRID